MRCTFTLMKFTTKNLFNKLFEQLFEQLRSTLKNNSLNTLNTLNKCFREKTLTESKAQRRFVFV